MKVGRSKEADSHEAELMDVDQFTMTKSRDVEVMVQ